MSCLYSRTLFLMEQSSCLGEDPTLPVSKPIYFSLNWYHSTRSAMYQETPLDNGRYQHNGLAPRRAELVAVLGCAYQFLQNALRYSSRHWLWSSIFSATALGRWDMTPDRWQVVLAGGTWLWKPCCPHREPTWRGGMAKACWYTLKSVGEIIASWAMPACMPRRVDVADWKDTSNVWPYRYEEMIFTRYEGKLMTVSL